LKAGERDFILYLEDMALSIHIIKILLWLLAIRYSIAGVSYCINHKTKKTNHRGPGNWRMPKDVLLALTEGYKIKVRSYSVRNSVSEELSINAVEEINGNTGTKEIKYGNRKRFPQFKTKRSDFIFQSELFAALFSKSFTKNYNSVFAISSENKINRAKKFFKNSIPSS
jgi:hypothetical protein